MSDIKAGVVIMNQYCPPQSKMFGSFIDYIDRKEAVRKENDFKYNLFNEYMGNPEKSTGLFTEDKWELDEEDKRELKESFKKAYDNSSLMWQTVISFDNRWLEENGLYDSATRMLDENKMKELSINAIHKMLVNEGLQDAVWSAAFHYNTDNVHIHVATVEENPSREKVMRQQWKYKKNENNRWVKDKPVLDEKGNPVYKEEYKGKFKEKSFQLAKQYIVNEVIKEKDLNKKINEVIRERMVKEMKRREIFSDKEIVQKVVALYSEMPNCKKSLWNYNSNIMKPLKSQIDQISDLYLEKYHADDFKELKDMLQKQSELYKQAYGDSKNDFQQTKMRDLYTRLGNSILKTVRAIEDIDSFPKNDDLENGDHKNLVLRHETFEKRIEEIRDRRSVNRLSSQKNNDQDSVLKRDYETENHERGEKKTNQQEMNSMQHLKKEMQLPASMKVNKNFQFEMALRELNRSFKKDFQAWKNILEHDRELMKEMENTQEAEF